MITIFLWALAALAGPQPRAAQTTAELETFGAVDCTSKDPHSEMLCTAAALEEGDSVIIRDSRPGSKRVVILHWERRCR